MFAEVAASIAADAADIAEPAAADAPESAGGVVTTVVDVDGGVVVVVAGGVIVVVDSSFLLQAANETAAAKVTISNAVFMFLLGFKVRQCLVSVGTLWSKSPIARKTRKAKHFQCPARDYRRLRCFP